MANTQKDPELHAFASGTKPFPPPPQETLKSALTKLGVRLREKRHYRRTQAQMKDAKRVSDRIMGEGSDA